MTHSILLVDDDNDLCELLTEWLEQEGFTINRYADCSSALSYLKNTQKIEEIVILDVMLPDGNGLELLKKLRTLHAQVPVLMLSARGEPFDKIIGLELGADDYLAKPCDPRELTARLRALLRRKQPELNLSKEIKAGDLVYSKTHGNVTVANEMIILTLSESRILELLLVKIGEPISKTILAKKALGKSLAIYDRSLDMHVSNLRKKLGCHPDGRQRIMVVRGRGYYYSA
ncbi:UNVERIFIED_CONTAM: hypothetical protein GTU68_029914 [Idotea baltica]|nr:hypothetical protein [Idotea baltica]